VFLARDARVTASAEAPVANVDHWHAAYGVYYCDQYLPPIAERPEDPLGIHSHGDGLIHIHPFGAGAAGSNAQMQVFADAVGLTFPNGDEVQMPADSGGQLLENGATCPTSDGGEEKAEVHLLRWPPQATENVDPDVIDGDFGTVRFTEDGEIFAFVMVPEGTDLNEIPLPPSVEQLANPLEAEGGGTQTPQTLTPATPGSETPPSDAPASTAPASTAPPTTAGN
jgi:hypothetical protein